jgi:hypothetical protein
MTPRSELNQMLERANDKLKNTSKNVYLQYDNGSYRIDWKDDNASWDKRSSGMLSPRMSIKNLIIWLDGFISGLDF